MVEIKVGQVAYEHFKLPKDDAVYYRTGVVIRKYDNVFFIKLSNGTIVSSFIKELKEDLGEDELGTMILQDNGTPVYAKKKWFGRYKI